MKFVDEYRDPGLATDYIGHIQRACTRSWTLMEVCGGQTHAIIKNGIDRMLPDRITLLHGPGCPVCVTPTFLIDQALDLASRPDVIFCTFADMLRVPGSNRDLLAIKAGGGDVRMVYSPLDCLRVAADNPAKEVVFFAIGFETTAPVNALTVCQARRQPLCNFSVLCAQVLIPPALQVILEAPGVRVQAFLAPGHVCSVTGAESYEELCSRYQVPIVITGFEPIDILQGIYMAVDQLERGQALVQNQYARAVRSSGNREAQKLIASVFRVVDREWRGFGVIPASGLALREEYARFDATVRFELAAKPVRDDSQCISGLVLQGRKKPGDCPLFGTHCRPEKPLGAPMVSSEGACAAYYRYRSAGIGSIAAPASRSQP